MATTTDKMDSNEVEEPVTPRTPKRRLSDASDGTTAAPDDCMSDACVSECSQIASRQGSKANRRDLLARLYKRLYDHYEGDKGKLTLFTIVMLIISDVPIYFYTLLDLLQLPWLYKYRLHYKPELVGHLGARKYPPRSVTWKCLKGAEMNFIFAYVIPGALAIKLADKLRIYVYDTEEKSVNWRRILMETFKISVLSDFCFYALHRFMHTDGWYIPYHKKHHQFKYTIACAHHWMTFKEAVLFMLPQGLPPLLLGLLTGKKMHVLSVWFAMFFTQLNVIPGHAGYQLPVPEWFPAFRAEYHDYHHVDYKVNFGAIYPFTDWIFGTYYKAGVQQACPKRLVLYAKATRR